jgi:hypothetical protein
MKYFYLFSFIFLSFYIHASSCCGGGSSSSLIITGDNKAEMSLGYSKRFDIGQSNQDGFAVLNAEKNLDHSQNINFQSEYQITDRVQLGTRFSIVDKSIVKSGMKENTKGLSDIEIQSTYEYLPDFTYSEYRPRGFVYIKLSIPTSKNLYNSTSSVFSDVRGTGIYSLSAGNFFIKKINSYTFKLTFEWSHLFGKSYPYFKSHDYDKFNIPLGLAFTPLNTDFTFGLTDTFNYQFGKKLSGEINSNSPYEYFWDLSLFVNYSPNRNDLWSLSYSDSTLIGKSINSPLYRTIGLNYTYAIEL